MNKQPPYNKCANGEEWTLFTGGDEAQLPGKRRLICLGTLWGRVRTNRHKLGGPGQSVQREAQTGRQCPA